MKKTNDTSKCKGQQGAKQQKKPDLLEETPEENPP
jgi:hypothetical protein